MFSKTKIAILFLIIGISHGRPQSWWEKFEENFSQWGKNVEESLKEMRENLAKKFNVTALEGLNSTSNAVNGTNGVNVHSRHVSIHSVEGTRNGTYYFDEIQDEVINGVQYHTERHYNPISKQIETTNYAKDLKDPDAKLLNI